MTADELREDMEAAAAALDFERAGRLRDRLSILRMTGADPGEDMPALTRQRPGAMGIGTSQSHPDRPEGWTPPVRPGGR